MKTKLLTTVSMLAIAMPLAFAMPGSAKAQELEFNPWGYPRHERRHHDEDRGRDWDHDRRRHHDQTTVIGDGVTMTRSS